MEQPHTGVFTRGQVAGALLVAGLTAILGFSLTWKGSLSSAEEPTPTPLARRLAEGREPVRREERAPFSMAHRAPRRDYDIVALPHPAKMRRHGEGSAGRSLPAPAVGSGLQGTPLSPPSPSTSPAPEKAREDPRPSGRPGPEPRPEVFPPPEVGYPLASRPPPRAARRASRETPEPPEETAVTRSWPPVPSRPEAVGLAEGWQRWGASLAVLERPDGARSSGVVLDPQGLLVTRHSLLGGAPFRVWLQGQPLPATPLGVLPEYDLALYQLPPGRTYPFRPLSPEEPASGEFLAFAPGFGTDPALYQEAQALGAIQPGSPGLYRFRGLVLPGSAGSPLVNERGEVAGLVLGKPWSYPGNGHNLAVDSAVLWGLLLDHHAGLLEREPGPLQDPVAGLLEVLRADLPQPTGGRVLRANNRVIPGVSLGNYELGMTRRELEQVLGPGLFSTTADGLAHLTYEPYRLRFTLVAGRVAAIATTDPFYATRRGVGVGVDLSGARWDPELEQASLGSLPGGRQYVAGRGVELEVGRNGRVERLAVVPR